MNFFFGFFFPFGFIFLFWIFGAGMAIYKMVMRQRAAREIALSHGLDPEQAAAATFLTPNGLDATYLAANLRGAQPAPTYAPPPSPTPVNAAHGVEARLHELALLKQQNVITQDEYDSRRKAILDQI